MPRHRPSIDVFSDFAWRGGGGGVRGGGVKPSNKLQHRSLCTVTNGGKLLMAVFLVLFSSKYILLL